MSAEQVLPVVRVGEIASDEIAERWLVEELWCASSVGVIGGAPKCAKTWLGLDMALSVATGTPCLGKYAVPEPGPVLVYLAEDALLVVRERIEGMARHRGLDLDQVEIYVITAPVLRLDRDRDRTRLWETARRLRPRLLLLDPLVRLHGIDENHAGEVAELLAYFRSLQRQLGLSVLLVHHTRKNAAGWSCRRSGTAWLGRYPCLRRLEPLSPANQGAPDPLQRAPGGTGIGAGLSGVGRHRRGDDPPGGDRGTRFVDRTQRKRSASKSECSTSWPEAECLRERGCVTHWRSRTSDLGEVLESLERAGQIGRTPAVGNASLTIERRPFRSPSREGERNGPHAR